MALAAMVMALVPKHILKCPIKYLSRVLSQRRNKTGPPSSSLGHSLRFSVASGMITAASGCSFYDLSLLQIKTHFSVVGVKCTAASDMWFDNILK